MLVVSLEGGFPLSHNFSMGTHVKCTRVNEIEAKYERPRVNVKVERGSTFTFTRDLPYISCGHTTDFYLGKTDLPRANSSKISRGKFISGFVLPR